MGDKNIIGHERARQILRRSIENDSISHSYLFEGEEGIGKGRLAKHLAKTLLCRKAGSSPCNDCISCYKVDNGHHPDLFIVETDKNLIKREEIDELIGETSTAPFESRKKVFIINEAEKMNIESQNALLKTLEEPPSYINIILTTSNPSKLLPTIQSRVESIKLYPIEEEKLRDYIQKKYKKTFEEASFIAKFTKGAIGKSIRLAESEDFFQLRDEVIDIIDALVGGDLTIVFSSQDFFEENKENIDQILDLFSYWFRDLLIYKKIGGTRLLVNRDKAEILSRHSHMDSERINDIIISIEETRRNIKRYINYQLSIEVMLLGIGGR